MTYRSPTTQILYFTLLSRAGATNLLLLTLLVPITAIAGARLAEPSETA